MFKVFVILCWVVFISGCGQQSPVKNSIVEEIHANLSKSSNSKSDSAAVVPSPTYQPGAARDFDAVGTVTKINKELGSVELDHEEIKGLMAKMRMEFYVSDKKMLDGLAVGDRVNFVVRDNDRTATIVIIKKKDGKD